MSKKEAADTRKLNKYTHTKFKASESVYDKAKSDYAVSFIQALCHTKGTWAGKPFELIDWHGKAWFINQKRNRENGQISHITEQRFRGKNYKWM